MKGEDVNGQAVDRLMLSRAARVALRGAGRVEPNPMVGCVIGRADGAILATAHHERFGGPHAEATALALCRARGHDVCGATAWVTLEPCNHFGKTPPCAQALIEAGITRVVYAQSDPHAQARGGAEALRARGIQAEESSASVLACEVSAPFLKRVRTGRPWVIAKWAQTRDGYWSFAGHEPRWISGESSRRDVHRLRGRVDAVITTGATVRADDPMLTARDVHVRRMARRVIVADRLEGLMGCALVRTARGETPVTVMAGPGIEHDPATRALRAAGVEVVEVKREGQHADFGAVLDDLANRHGVSTVLIEAGPRFVGGVMRAGYVDETWVYGAPMEAGSHGGVKLSSDVLGVGGWQLMHEKRIGVDVRQIYRRPVDGQAMSGSGAARR